MNAIADGIPNGITLPVILAIIGGVFLLLALFAPIEIAGRVIIPNISRERRTLAFALGVICIAIAIVLFVPAPAPISDGVTPTFAASATATPSPTFTPSQTHTPSPTPTPMVYEDFESGLRMIWWSPDPDVFDYPLSAEQAHGGNWSLKISYNKSGEFQFLGAEPPEELRDFSRLNTLEVWVFGRVELLLKLHDVQGQEAEIDRQSAANADEWQVLRFNIGNARTRIDLTRIDNLFFFPAPGAASASGIIYFDDIALVWQE
jgi:hypothetical protein